MDIRSLKKKELIDLLINNSKIKSRMLKKTILNELLRQRIFPLKIKNKNKKDIILNSKNVRKFKGKWSLPRGLYLNIFKEDEKLIRELSYFSKNYFKQNVQKHLCDINNLPIKIRSSLINIIKKLFCNLYSDKDVKEINNIIKKSKISFLYYRYKPNDIFEGLKAHINDFQEYKGCISVISFSDSILDFIPFNELKKEKDFRVVIPKFSAVTFDGDLRYCYTHGVPKGIKYRNKHRFALNIRHPFVKSKNSNCSQCSIVKNWKCHSNINLEPLKISYE